MILPNMTESELADEVICDKRNAMVIINAKDDKVMKLTRRATRFPYHVHSIFTTKRRNTWLALWEIRTKPKKYTDAMLSAIAVSQSTWGRHAYTTIKDHDIVVSYTPHLFSRYAERMELDLTGMELIRHFFERNCEPVYRFGSRPNSEQLEIFASCADGVLMGIVHPLGRVYEMRTFVTHDMLMGQQIDVFAESEAARREMYDKMYQTELNKLG